MVEHYTFNVGVESSNLSGITKKYKDMPWIAVDKNGMEAIFQFRPVRSEILERFLPLYSYSMTLPLPKGSAKKLIGRELKWEDEPVELKILDYDS